MKKALLLLISLLAATCTTYFTGYTDGNHKESSMPKVRFEFKDGSPV